MIALHRIEYFKNQKYLGESNLSLLILLKAFNFHFSITNSFFATLSQFIECTQWSAILTVSADPKLQHLSNSFMFRFWRSWHCLGEHQQQIF